MELDPIVEDFLLDCEVEQSLRRPLSIYVISSWILYGSVQRLSQEDKKILTDTLTPKQIRLVEIILSTKGIEVHIGSTDEDITSLMDTVLQLVGPEEDEEPKEEKREFHRIPRHKKQSISHLLEPLQIDEEIKAKAEECFSSLDIRLKEGERTILVLFYCVNKAYQLLSILRDPKIIADLVGLKYQNISKAINYCSPKDTSRQETSHRTPLEFIPDLASMVGLDESLRQQALDFGRMTLDMRPSLLDEFPQTIAAGIISVFIDLVKFQMKKKEFLAITRKSDMTIQKARLKIIEAYSQAGIDLHICK